MTTDDTGAMMALRGRAREQLRASIDQGKVAYDLVHDAPYEGVTPKQVSKIVADLRGEGLIK